MGINGNVATPGYSTLPDGSRKLTMITDGAMTPSKMYDQNQQYKEGLQIGEYINVTFGGDHAGTGTVFALPQQIYPVVKTNRSNIMFRR